MKLKNKAKNPTHAIFGVATDGSIINAPISTFPHALITGTTNSGKSVFLNSLLTSVMAIAHPDELKLIIIDPKGNEFGNYKDIPFMLTNPIIDLSDSASALEYLASEMDYRLQLFQKYGGKKNLEKFNDAIDKEEIKGVEKLPYIILVIDELADLMVQYKNEVEGSIKRLGAKARASGVHMLLATQTPRKEYVDGAIKANVGTSFALMAANTTESLVTLGETGAEKLRKYGDFLAKIGGGQLQRGQAPLVEDEELLEIFEYQRSEYPAPDLIDINDALDDTKLRYKKLVAENSGKNPDEVTMDNVKEEEKTSSIIMPSAKQSSRSEEERQKAREQHEKTMAQLEENKKNGNEGGKTVSIDTSKFSFAERNKRRKEKGFEEKKSNSGIIPASSSKANRKRKNTSTKTDVQDKKENQKAKPQQSSKKPSTQKETRTKSEPKNKTTVQTSTNKEVSTRKPQKPKRKPSSPRGSVSSRIKNKNRPTSRGGSPLARKR